MSPRLRHAVALSALLVLSLSPAAWAKDLKGPLTQATFQIDGLS